VISVDFLSDSHQYDLLDSALGRDSEQLEKISPTHSSFNPDPPALHAVLRIPPGTLKTKDKQILSRQHRHIPRCDRLTQGSVKEDSNQFQGGSC